MADVNGVAQIELLDQFGDVGGVGVHLVAGNRLGGTAVAAAVVGDNTKAAFEKEHHLRVPIVGCEWPAMVKEEGLAFAPVLVEDLGAVFGGEHAHGVFSWCGI